MLCGFKGCGKTHFAKRLNLPFLDLDALIEEKAGCSIKQLIMQYGKTHFRRVEKDIATTLRVDGHVIALGGGTPLDPDSLKHLKSLGTFLYLKCPKELLKKRILSPPYPAFISSDEDFEKIYSQRIPYYEKIADHIIEMEDQSESAILEALWQVINLETSLESPLGASLMAKPSVL